MNQSLDRPSPESVTGISGLDNVLGGGLTPSRVYLLEGCPGSGKTTLALQFLLEGVRLNEPCASHHERQS
jgi:circadian clock protein KaiC